jgi:hypothetical protein
MNLLSSFNFWKPKKVFDIQNIYGIGMSDFYPLFSIPKASLDSTVGEIVNPDLRRQCLLIQVLSFETYPFYLQLWTFPSLPSSSRREHSSFL